MNNPAFKVLDPLKYAWNTMILRWKDLISPCIFIGIIPFIILMTLGVILVMTTQNIPLLQFLNFPPIQPPIDLIPNWLYYFSIKSITIDNVLALNISPIITFSNSWWYIIMSFLWYHVWAHTMYTKISLDCYENKSIDIKKNILFLLPLMVKILLILLPFKLLSLIHEFSYSIILGLLFYYFTIRLYYFIYFIIDKNYGIQKSLIASFMLTHNHFWRILGTLLIFGALLLSMIFLIPIIGMIAPPLSIWRFGIMSFLIALKFYFFINFASLIDVYIYKNLLAHQKIQ